MSTLYTGANPSALRSQQLLCEALLGLLGRGRALGELTVSELCRKAGVSRQTFYHHFGSIEDVARLCLRRNYVRRLADALGSPELNVGEAAEAFVRVLEDNRALLATLLDAGLSSMVTEEVGTCVSLISSQMGAQTGSGEYVYARAFLVGGLAQVASLWVRGDVAGGMSAGELSQLLRRMLRDSYFDGRAAGVPDAAASGAAASDKG